MSTKPMPALRAIARIGNIVFILWILYNGIDEFGSGSRVTPVHVVAYLGIIVLLLLNFFLLAQKKES